LWKAALNFFSLRVLAYGVGWFPAPILKIIQMKILQIIILVALIIWLLVLTSCKIFDPCDPENIKSGKSSQRHDSRPFKASIKIINTQQQGSSCYVKYQNMKEVTYRLYDHCDCGKFKEGRWIKLDSI
jgi:hypothetical protein